MNLIDGHQLSDLLQLFLIILCLRIGVDDVRHGLGPDNAILLQRFDHLFLILLIFLNNADHLIQQDFGGLVDVSGVHIIQDSHLQKQGHDNDHTQQNGDLSPLPVLRAFFSTHIYIPFHS